MGQCDLPIDYLVGVTARNPRGKWGQLEIASFGGETSVAVKINRE
jgi:hypothetical protein